MLRVWLLFCGLGLLAPARLNAAPESPAPPPAPQPGTGLDGGVGALDSVVVEMETECFSAADLKKDIETQLNSSIPEGLLVRVSSEGFFLLRSGRVIAERRFSELPDECEVKREALTVAIVVALEHALEEQQAASVAAGAVVSDDAKASAPGQGAEELRPKSVPPEDEKGKVSPAEAPLPAFLRLGTGAVVLLETLPETAFGGQVFVQALISEFSVGLGALVSSQVTTDLGEELGAIRTRIWGVRAEGCFEPGLGNLLLQGCGGLVGGRMLALGSPGVGPEAGKTERGYSPWVAAFLGAGVLIPAHQRFGLLARIDAYVHLLRPAAEMRVAYLPAETKTAEPGPVGAQAAFSAVVHLR